MVNVKDSQSEPWSSDVGSIPGFTYKLDGYHGPLDGRKRTKIIKTAKRGKSHQKNIKKRSGVKTHVVFSDINLKMELNVANTVLKPIFRNFRNK